MHEALWFLIQILRLLLLLHGVNLLINTSSGVHGLTVDGKGAVGRANGFGVDAIMLLVIGGSEGSGVQELMAILHLIHRNFVLRDVHLLLRKVLCFSETWIQFHVLNEMSLLPRVRTTFSK